MIIYVKAYLARRSGRSPHAPPFARDSAAAATRVARPVSAPGSAGRTYGCQWVSYVSTHAYGVYASVYVYMHGVSGPVMSGRGQNLSPVGNCIQEYGL